MPSRSGTTAGARAARRDDTRHRGSIHGPARGPAHTRFRGFNLFALHSGEGKLTKRSCEKSNRMTRAFRRDNETITPARGMVSPGHLLLLVFLSVCRPDCFS
ncbi:hypothetical protein JDM601_1455 [Mycolicibacter sinensis]|uniref:Uncharacterized protein n=1 Tax=Mycolicibacter sinensis (strain JDM601) TaxID=875328 RepID=F5YY76_MYCSD|nr:hypothetical protein JDM601_1455 [Mycolicibacter sinensis]